MIHEHHHDDYVEVVSSKGPAQLSGSLKMTYIGMAVVGLLVFAVQAFLNKENARIGWIALLHNLYFFTGLSAAGLAIAAILQAARANWGRPVKRIAEAMGAFLPVGLIAIAILYFGAGQIYEWVDFPPTSHNKAFWLQKNFLFGRDLVALFLLWFVGRRFTTASDRADFGLAHETNPDLWEKPANWQGTDAEVEKGQKAQGRFAVFYCFLYAFVVSLLAFDLIMSLDYHWISTMFGGWHFCSFLLIGWGTLYALTHLISNRFEITKYFPKPLYHDLGKLTFGFTVVWGYLFYAQYLVIWYGNMGHETGYLLTRFQEMPWKPLAFITFGIVFLIPFILGLGKNRKMQFKSFWPIVAMTFIGVWLERFILIAPAAWYFNREDMTYDGGVGMLMASDFLVFLGFFGIFALTFTSYLYKRPLMVISDPRLPDGIHRH